MEGLRDGEPCKGGVVLVCAADVEKESAAPTSPIGKKTTFL